jgi:hypothetical protein
MNGVFLAELAILLHLDSVGIVLLILHRVIVALLAFRTSKSDLVSHNMRLRIFT